MAITVNFYRFSKRTNSTLRPTDGNLVAARDCILLDASSIQAPVIRLDQSDAAEILRTNYAYIPLYERYYFVGNWTFDGPFMTANLLVDVLATWKESIGTSTEYVLRSSATFDRTIADGVYPMTADISVETVSKETNYAKTLADGTYVVGTAGTSGTIYYAMTYNQFTQFFHYLYSDDYANQVVAGWASVFPTLKAQVNPIQYITTVTWIPFTFTGYPVDGVLVGWGYVPVACGHVVDPLYGLDATIDDIPKHPDAANRGNYLNQSPFSEYVLQIPPFGTLTLNAERVSKCRTIHCDGIVDVRTGTANMYINGAPVTTPELFPLAHLQGNLGIPIQIAQMTGGQYGQGEFLLDALKGAAAVATGNIGGVFSTIRDAAGSLTGSTNTVGSTGGFDSLRGNVIFKAIFHGIANEDNPHLGRPLCQRRQLSTIPGYIQIDNADIAIPGTADENDKIKSYLEGGFFYE